MRRTLLSRIATAALVAAGAMASPPVGGFVRAALAAGDDPVPAPTRSADKPSGHASAAELVNRGQELSKKREWQLAEESFRAATELQPELPEAWNGLGHALKNEWRFDESVSAYERALALRPRYPQALEYLGEAYVLKGDARRAREVLARLRPLDERMAEHLAQVIDGKTAVASGW